MTIRAANDLPIIEGRTVQFSFFKKQFNFMYQTLS